MALLYPEIIFESANVPLTNLFIEGKNVYIVSELNWDYTTEEGIINDSTLSK